MASNMVEEGEFSAREYDPKCLLRYSIDTGHDNKKNSHHIKETVAKSVDPRLECCMLMQSALNSLKLASELSQN